MSDPHRHGPAESGGCPARQAEVPCKAWATAPQGCPHTVLRAGLERCRKGGGGGLPPAATLHWPLEEQERFRSPQEGASGR